MLAPLLAAADEVETLHQFTPGTPARAAEVNENFSAVRTAVNDNAGRVAALETALPVAGVPVRVNGETVGRLVGHERRPVEVNAADTAGGGTWRVAEAADLPQSAGLRVVSATGYHFSVATGDFDSSRVSEGELGFSTLFYEGAQCSGDPVQPVEGDTGFFSTFNPNVGDNRPVKRWFARQGAVFASPDPADPVAAYMIPRGVAIRTASLVSARIWAEGPQAAFCLTLGNLTAFDPLDPADVDHPVVPVEPWDPELTAVFGTLGGEVTVGF